jgi:hypothetical protein
MTGRRPRFPFCSIYSSLRLIARDEYEVSALSTPMVYLPVNRSTTGIRAARFRRELSDGLELKVDGQEVYAWDVWVVYGPGVGRRATTEAR